MPTTTTHVHRCDRCGAEIDEPKITPVGKGDGRQVLSIRWQVTSQLAAVDHGYDMLCTSCTRLVIDFLLPRKL